jgi:predicted peroxiredoxin
MPAFLFDGGFDMKSVRKWLVVLLTMGSLAVSATAAAKESVFVNLTSDDGHRVTMCLMFARSLVKDGQDVTLFLNVDSVRLASTKVQKLAEQRKELQAFMQDGGKVIVCPHCLKVRNVAEGDLIKGLVMGGKGEGREAFLGSTRSITY